jgi:hypothetical protein
MRWASNPVAKAGARGGAIWTSPAASPYQALIAGELLDVLLEPLEDLPGQ